MQEQGKEETLASFKAFSKSISKKLEQRVEQRTVETAFDSFSHVFSTETSSEGVKELRKQLSILETKLQQSAETIREMKLSDEQLMKVNSELYEKVEALSTENKKLFSLARYLRHFERENMEMRFAMGDLFKPKKVQG
eukprot:CAMPEP_0203757942 /NCGR_PEP_ID=MMETSP0098-20131031/10770_1 /ASSEMBLY_ACC=CAM_ASM_000208 /TAXON_ID=96639 /ORGANISM=" , Strain NY0313808BC1" /LENGTH=137 /DNA_ID=CAMNT_0050650187 /DNA_START=258 /DNA_END=671 /DNA_ORIENTATION=-